MHTCPYCGYEIQEFEAGCPRCNRAHEKPAPAKPPAHPTMKPPVGHPDRPRVPRRALIAVGARTGALSGAAVLALVPLIDRLLIGAWNPDPLDILTTVLLSAFVGAVLGALVGMGIAYSDSTSLGVIAGAIVIGLARFAGGFNTAPKIVRTRFGTRIIHSQTTIPYLDLVLGATYGIVFGIVVAYFVNRALKRRIELSARLDRATLKKLRQEAQEQSTPPSDKQS